MCGPVTYRGWNVHYDNPPIPLRSMDWSATSPDYDVDCDEDGFHVCAGQQVHAATYDALIAEIDTAIDEAVRCCDDCDFSTTDADVTVCPDQRCRGHVG